MSTGYTSEWLRAYEARRQVRAACPAGDQVEREAELHEQIRADVARRGWIGFHGSMAHRTHRTVGEPDWVIIADLVEGRP